MKTFLFFGRLRDQAGESRRLEPSPEVRTVADLRGWLDKQIEGLKCAADTSVRFVADGEVVTESSDISAAREIALLPPLSGG